MDIKNALNSTVFEYAVVIRETDLDTFGHVNNAVYLRLFEEARWDILNRNGYGLARVQELKVGPTILDIHLQFRREVKNREAVTIRSWLTVAEGKTQTMRQIMINSKGEEACIADFLIALFDLNARRIVAPTAEWKKAVGLPDSN